MTWPAFCPPGARGRVGALAVRPGLAALVLWWGLAGCSSLGPAGGAASGADGATGTNPAPGGAAAGTSAAGAAPGAEGNGSGLPEGTLAQRLAMQAADLLERGQEEQAVAELQRALQHDPQNKLAVSLMRQIHQDPLAALGRESFTYRVQPGETLSRIAQRFMGDLYQFYILARYNDIKVPKQLSGGQVIRVPGKAPPPAPAPVVAKNGGRDAPKEPGREGGKDAAKDVPVAGPSVMVVTTAEPPPREPAMSEAERKRQVEKLLREARAAHHRQQLEREISLFDQLLQLDPQHRLALIERQRAMDLLERLKTKPRQPKP